MIQTKFSLDKPQAQFLNRFKHYGFKDKSEVVREALSRLQLELEQKRLQDSAELYAELYETDDELKGLTEAAIEGWPK